VTYLANSNSIQLAALLLHTLARDQLNPAERVDSTAAVIYLPNSKSLPLTALLLYPLALDQLTPAARADETAVAAYLSLTASP
jgi:hypothetical protein